jgi:hypothetical protein
VTTARVCLLNPEKKAAYDAHLQSRLADSAPAPQEADVLDFIARAGVEPLAGQSAAGPLGGAPVLARRRRDPGLAVMIGILAVGLVLVVGLILVRQARDGQPVFESAVRLDDWPEHMREGAVLEINGKRQTVPAAGQLDYPCEPGKIHILATIPGFKPFERTVVVEAGQKRVVHTVWQK